MDVPRRLPVVDRIARGAPKPRSRQSRATREVHAGGRCQLSCKVCDCRFHSDPKAPRELVRRGGRKLTLRGDPLTSADPLALLESAREAGYLEIVLRSHGLEIKAEPELATRAHAAGATGILVPLFSHIPKVHDRLTGKPGSLQGSLTALRIAARAGLRVEIEIPLLPPNLQSAAPLLELAWRAEPSLAAVRFRIPKQRLHRALAPPPMPLLTPQLVAALEKADELGVAVVLSKAEGVPMCALGDRPDLLTRHFRFDLRGPKESGPTICGGCAANRHCAKPAGAYTSAHDARGLRPLSELPAGLRQMQRTSGAQKWTEAARDAASKAQVVVLRPTVNCNQDCGFCSANQSSRNVWEDPAKMLRAIARAGHRGVDRISFSGGEPTLSRHLPSFVAVARKSGIAKIELVTNAVLLDREPKVRALRDAGLTHAFVSLHAHDEALSQRITQKPGDFARTLRGIHFLVESGVITVLNHVICSTNARHLTRFMEFVHAELGARAAVNFAFVTPQFKALENFRLVPRISDVMPHLRRAMYRGMDLGVPFVVGSRQGIPPCLLGEFAAWSDIFELMNEARAEDAFQKQKADDCQRCRFTHYCTGLWRPYSDRFGLGELRPVPGTPLHPDDPDAGARIVNLAAANHFEDIPELLRDRAGEAEGRALVQRVDPPEPTFPSPGEVLTPSRPLRALLIGSGNQAHRVARAARDIPELSIDAVASPHAPEIDLAELGHCPAYGSVSEALEDMRPDVALVCAATDAHEALTALCLGANVACLVEKPVGGDPDAAKRLQALAAATSTLVMPMHQLALADGLEQVAAPPKARVRLDVAFASDAPDLPRSWAASSLFETLYHHLSLLLRVAAEPIDSVVCLHSDGASRPQLLSLQLLTASRELTLRWRTGADNSLVLSANDAVLWQRSGRETRVRGNDGLERVQRTTSDVGRALQTFADAKRRAIPAPVDLTDAVRTLSAARACLDAIRTSGRSLDLALAPRHASGSRRRND